MKTCSLVGIFWQPLGKREKFSMTHSILIQFVCNRMLSRTHISHPFQKKLCLPTYISKRLGHSCSFGRAASHTLFPFQTTPYVMIWVHLCVSVLIPPPKSNTVWLRKYYRLHWPWLSTCSDAQLLYRCVWSGNPVTIWRNWSMFECFQTR